MEKDRRNKKEGQRGNDIKTKERWKIVNESRAYENAINDIRGKPNEVQFNKEIKGNGKTKDLGSYLFE